MRKFNRKEYMKKYLKEYFIVNRETIKEYNKKYYKDNRDVIKSRQIEYCEKNKDAIRKTTIKYCKHNAERLKKWRGEYFNLRSRRDINFKMKYYLRTRIWNALKGVAKSASTMELIGCSTECLKGYLESKFKKGMTWKNYGKWHVDHIRPCVLFDLSEASEQKKCFNYTNLQPLWAKENLKKGSKYKNKEI